jgi:hypothetical protein
MKYRNVVPGLALLAALAMVMAGVTAVRLGFVAVEIKRGPRLGGAESVTRPVESTRVTAAKPAPAAAPRLRVREDARLINATIVATAATTAGSTAHMSAAPAVQVEPSATVEAGALRETLATPVAAAAAVTALPSKALAASTGAAKRVAECATRVATAANVDPTDGEISGMTGLPDQVSYFKAKGRKAAQCRPLAGPTASTR